MLSSRKIVGGVAGLILIAGTSIGATSASAGVADDPVGCAVVGAVTITPGVNPPPGNTNTFSFTSATLTCAGAPGNDDAGTYTVSASGNTKGITSPGEDCAQGQSDGPATLTGTTPNDGNATGSFTFTRVGTTVTVTDGSFATTDPVTGATETHSFQAELQFTPTTGTCTPGSPVTVAAITGTAHITDDASGV